MNAPSLPARADWITRALCAASLVIAWGAWHAASGDRAPASRSGHPAEAASATQATSPATHSPWGPLSEASAQLTARVRPSVVRIFVGQASPGNDASTAPAGHGSGFVVAPEGWIVTSHHVIRGQESIWVEVPGRGQHAARLVTSDAQHDLALLRIELVDLVPLTWADSETLAAGQFIWAFGAPFGWRPGVTFGLLSARPQASDTDAATRGLLQADVALNPGQSGGPWINAEGQVVGVSTIIVGRTFQGVSFATPSNLIRAFVDGATKSR